MTQKFIILAEPRSGSGHLARFFYSNVEGVDFYKDPDRSHYEILQRLTGFKDRISKLDSVYEREAATFIGAKTVFLPRQIPRKCEEPILDWLIRNNVKVILLKRNDSINQIVSYAYARFIKCYHHYDKEKFGIKKGSRVTLPLIGKKCKDKWSGLDRITGIFDDIKRASELFRRRLDGLATVIDFPTSVTSEGRCLALNIIGYRPTEHGRINSHPLEPKFLQHSYQDIVENYDEVFDFLISKGWTN